MKKSINLFGLLGIMALSACSESDLPADVNTGNNVEGKYLAVQIANPATTRAEGDQSNDGDATFEEGYANENKINSLRFYFFDKDGIAVNVSQYEGQSVNFVHIDDASKLPGDGSANMPNVEDKMKAVIVINTKDNDQVTLSSMVAVANTDKKLGKFSMNLSTLQTEIEDYGAIGNDKNNFIMTSSSYADANGQLNVAYVKPENLCATPEDAINSPVDIYIERVVAKVRTKSTVGGAKNVTLDNKSVIATPLEDTFSNGKQVYVVFTGWNVTGTAPQTYLLKKINSQTAWTETANGLDWDWNSPSNFRSYWATNPEGMKIVFDKTYKDYNISLGNDEEEKAYATYCMENAADDNLTGLKNSYEPAEALSNRTQVVIAGTLVTVNEENVATSLDIAKWGGLENTQENIAMSMFNASNLGNEYFIEDGIEADGKMKYKGLSIDQVELVAAEEAFGEDQVLDDAQDDKRYLSYLQLTDGAKQLKFYTIEENPATGEKTATLVDYKIINNRFLEMTGAKVWKSGATYYYTDLKHLGKEETKGKYGVVRNHIYDVNITSVKGLGTPVLDETQIIIPQKPGDDETFIAARINILSWRVVNNDTELEW